MRSLILTLFILVGALLSACPNEAVQTDMPLPNEPADSVIGDRRPILVELFTSEGCSSCPPADRNLAFLEKQQPVSKAEIITLAFHVDYWDRLGWKDRFSSPLFTQRQVIYSSAFELDSAYTPQMVVDGQAQFVGSDSGRASKEILGATNIQKAKIELAVNDRHVMVKISEAPAHADATVYIAIAEDGISTRVERGENSGKTLQHVSVVRELKTLGTLVMGKAEFEGAMDIELPSDSKTENLKLVVFVQENNGRKVLGAARAFLKK